jgi:hypothetical protein
MVNKWLAWSKLKVILKDTSKKQKAVCSADDQEGHGETAAS